MFTNFSLSKFNRNKPILAYKNPNIAKYNIS
jgi:hypothetical protein